MCISWVPSESQNFQDIFLSNEHSFIHMLFRYIKLRIHASFQSSSTLLLVNQKLRKQNIHTKINKIDPEMPSLFLNLACSCPYSYNFMLTATYICRPVDNESIYRVDTCKLLLT